MANSTDLITLHTVVAGWTHEQLSEYVALSWESYSERTAEAGSGAISLGYDTDGAYAAMAEIPHPNTDALFRAADARLTEITRRQWLTEPAPAFYCTSDDIPF